VIILGVDTSLPLLSVALIRDEVTLGAIALEGKASRNEKLLPAIDWLLTESGVDRHAIDLYAVTRGPGSFTGVRIGLATVQGMALALGKPVCAMSTHEAIARPVARSVIVDDAGRGEFYVSVYEQGTAIEAPHLAKTAPSGPDVMSVADAIQYMNVALRCAQRAAKIAHQNRLDDYRDATPIYVRLAEAEVKLQQKRDA
jgi:tRNA threonylcarbamoyl adenosine modification protein YeaZ